MGVIISQHLGAAVSRRAVRRQEGGRIDLEVARRVSGDIGGGDRPFYAILPARQNAATLLRVGFVGFFTQSCDHVTCHFNIHPQILQAMGASENIIQGFIGSEGGRLDRALADASGLSRERIKALMSEGRILLAGKPVSQASLKVAGGTAFAIDVPEAAPAEAVAQDIPLNVVFEDEYLIIVDKPAGLVVHPAAGNLDGTLVNALLHHCRGQLSGIGGVARPGIVHRIDKDTSGLLVVAKTDKAHEGLAVQFADHSIARAYRAVVSGRPIPVAGTVRGAIARSSVNRKKMALVEDGRGKHAVTHYRTLEALKNASLVECRLETGRTHQVRVHMSSIGHSLLGDPVYGRTPSAIRPILQRLGFTRQALHAAELGFVHPVTGENVHFISPLPDDMRTLIDELRH
ncbi:MAG: pseudouridine synthase [Novosphingobium lindaniclasticum]|nr:pseudouridine synthase [Novosphingobium lindaniclasticum]